MPNRIRRTAAILALAAAPPAAAAGISADGTAVGDETATVNRITLDHALVWTSIQYEPIAATEPGSPFGGLGGPCFGQVEIDGDEVSGGGYCVWTDGEGDALTTRWVATGIGDAPNTTAGTWEAVEGTGKWQDAAGGGSYRLSIDETTGRHLNRLAGTLTTP